MNDWFTWKGKRCTEYGIRVIRQPDYVRPQERVTFTSVPGRSGSLTILEGQDVYDDLLVSVECILLDLTRLNEITQWLKGADKVTFATRQGGFFYAHVVNQIAFEQVMRGKPHRRFAVNFRCQPFFYLSDIPAITVITSGSYVNNPGSVFAQPVLQITMSGDAQISVGTSYFELIGITGTVTVDSVLTETYMNNASHNSHHSGDYPRLHPGANIISWSGNVSKISITPNWRTL